MTRIRETVMRRSGGHCETCATGRAVEAHHVLSGPLRRVKESVDTVLALCLGSIGACTGPTTDLLESAALYCEEKLRGIAKAAAWLAAGRGGREGDVMRWSMREVRGAVPWYRRVERSRAISDAVVVLEPGADRHVFLAAVAVAIGDRLPRAAGQGWREAAQECESMGRRLLVDDDPLLVQDLVSAAVKKSSRPRSTCRALAPARASAGLPGSRRTLDRPKEVAREGKPASRRQSPAAGRRTPTRL